MINLIPHIRKTSFAIWKIGFGKGLNFCPETPGYNKLKLIGNLFRFFKNLPPKVVFFDDTGTATNNNNTVYDKTQERTDISKQLKNRSFEDHCDKLNQYISSINNGIIN